jgi:Peptidase A4 family
MRGFRMLLAGGSAVLLSAGLALGGTAAATAGTHHQGVTPPPPKGFTIVPGQRAGGSGLTQVKYTNWSGYADAGSGEKYSKVSSSWTQPKITCNPSISGYQWTVFWIGIDGFSNGTVEQDGSEAYCIGGKGPFYGTWWEHYPVNDIQTVGTTVKAGDKITASVVRSGTKYIVKITDVTTPANSFTHSFTCSSTACADTSAEWIAEAPGGDSTASGLYPLAQFAPWTNSNSAVATPSKSGNIKTFPDDEITMVSASNGTTVKAKPGPLNSSGTTFGVTWKNAGP